GAGPEADLGRDPGQASTPQLEPLPRKREKRTRKATLQKKRGGGVGLLPACFTSYRLGAWAPDDQAARLAFAFSAMAPNALMSCTAMSASTLRSIVMPALERPLISRL